MVVNDYKTIGLCDEVTNQEVLCLMRQISNV